MSAASAGATVAAASVALSRALPHGVPTLALPQSRTTRRHAKRKQHQQGKQYNHWPLCLLLTDPANGLELHGLSELDGGGPHAPRS